MFENHQINQLFVAHLQGEILQLNDGRISCIEMDDLCATFLEKQQQTIATIAKSYFNLVEFYAKCLDYNTIAFAQEWTVDNIRSLCMDQSRLDPMFRYTQINSTKFSPFDSNEYAFSLLLYPKGRDDGSKDFVSLYLNLISSPILTRFVLVLMKFSILNVNEQKCNSKGLRKL